MKKINKFATGMKVTWQTTGRQISYGVIQEVVTTAIPHLRILRSDNTKVLIAIKYVTLV